MSERPDENGRLTSLLQALRAPEPSAEFLAGARRRYLVAIEARDRRQVLTGLGAALVSLAVLAILLGPTNEPAVLLAGLAEVAADLARWTTGVGVVLALVPLAIWASAALGSAAAVLSLVLVARGRSLAPVRSLGTAAQHPGLRAGMAAPTRSIRDQCIDQGMHGRDSRR